MEAGSVPQAPAGAEGEQASAEQQVTPQTPAGEQQAEQGSVDVGEQLAAMRQQLDTLTSQQQGSEGSADEDLVSMLTSPEADDDLAGDLNLTPEEEAAALTPEQEAEVQPDQQQALQELDAFVAERIQQAVEPIQIERRREQLDMFQRQHPDVRDPEVFERLSGHLSQLVDLTGNEALKTDPRAVGLAYKAAKAELADAAAVPAEQAATDASLETQAGQTQAGESTVEEQYINALVGGRSTDDLIG